MLHQNRHINFFLKLGYTLLIIFLVGFTARFGLRLGWPFMLALLFAAMIRRPVEYLTSRAHLPRGPVAALFTALILCVGAVGIYLLASFVFFRARDLVDALPSIVDGLMADLTVFETTVDDLLHEIPFLADMPFISVRDMLSSTLSKPQINFMGVFSSLSSVVGSIPGFLFTAVFIFMGTYFFTVQRHEVKDFISRNLPPEAIRAAADLKDFLSHSLLRWLKAQLLLMSITCAELLIALMLMGQSNPIPLAIGIAVIDALPILGVGTVLIPWAVFSLLTGGFKKALWLMATYLVILCVRNTIEPRVVGQKIGLNPFITLLSMFIGFRLGGFFGLAFVPIAVLSIQKLQELGYINLWN